MNTTTIEHKGGDEAASLEDMFARQRRDYAERGGLSFEERRQALDRLLAAVLADKERVAEAISSDFGHRSRHETLLAEIFTTVNGIRHARRNLRKWMKPRRRAVGYQFLPASAKVVSQPLGVVGVASPWNYPFQLAVLPLVGALAAGNRVLLKPSELTPRTSALLAEMLGDCFPPEKVAVVQGGIEVGQAFTALPFDHLLFTGSSRAGREVMRAAAGNLTPVTLELGGKSPAILDEGCALEKAVESIVAGKLLNAGQTCIAPDYVLLPKGREEDFTAAVRKAVDKLYPSAGAVPNPDYTSIIDARHFRRLHSYLDEARAKGARVIEVGPPIEAGPEGAGTKGAGPEGESDGRRMPLSLVLEADPSLAVMQEEIFGPILPVVPYEDLEGAISYVNAGPRPLALYYFGEEAARRDHVLDRTVSGGVSVNETLFHCAVDNLPFGGVGASGMGAYHGIDGFNTFSHRKAVFQQGRFNAAGLLRPPYGRLTGLLMKLLIGR